MWSAEFERIITIVIVAVALVWVVARLFEVWLKTRNLNAVNAQVKELRADLPWMNTVEGNIQKSPDLQQLTAFSRNVLLPLFMIGLQIVPQGDAKTLIKDSLDLYDKLTDLKPNEPPEQPATTLAKG